MDQEKLSIARREYAKTVMATRGEFGLVLDCGYGTGAAHQSCRSR